jgi:DNA-binding XRE family transcriptional regulator
MATILPNEKRKFLRMLIELKQRRAQTFSQDEVATYLGISRRTLVDFEHGRIYNFWLLCRYGDLLGLPVVFY